MEVHNCLCRTFQTCYSSNSRTESYVSNVTDRPKAARYHKIVRGDLVPVLLLKQSQLSWSICGLTYQILQCCVIESGLKNVWSNPVSDHKYLTFLIFTSLSEENINRNQKKALDCYIKCDDAQSESELIEELLMKIDSIKQSQSTLSLFPKEIWDLSKYSKHATLWWIFLTCKHVRSCCL